MILTQHVRQHTALLHPLRVRLLTQNGSLEKLALMCPLLHCRCQAGGRHEAPGLWTARQARPGRLSKAPKGPPGIFQVHCSACNVGYTVCIRSMLRVPPNQQAVVWELAPH